MIEDKVIKIAIYTRVSTLLQVEEGFSLDAQKDKLIKLADSNGYVVYKIYEEQGKSGKNTNRPQFQKMMEDMRQHKFSKILVMKLDRISRSVSDLENIIKELQENNCGFESASEKIDTTSAMGLMFIRLLGIFAQFERERISERIKDVIEEKIQKGLATTGSLPIGYKIGTNEQGEKIVIKDSNKIDFVNAIFDTYEKTSSLIKTCIYLNTNYPDLVYNGGFTTTDLKRIMLNPMYYGKFKTNEHYCEPYLSYERWKKINDMRENKNLKSSKKNTYLFTGILKGTCGHKFAGTTYCPSRTQKIRKYSYRCQYYAHSGGCKNYHIPEDVIEQKILELIPSTINTFIDNYEKEYAKVNAKDNTKLILSLENEKKRIINSYNKGWMNETEAEEEITRIDEEIEKYKSTVEKKDYSNLKKIAEMSWLDVYNDLTRENKRLFFREFIELITVDVDRYRAGYEDFIEIKLKD